MSDSGSKQQVQVELVNDQTADVRHCLNELVGVIDGLPESCRGEKRRSCGLGASLVEKSTQPLMDVLCIELENDNFASFRDVLQYWSQEKFQPLLDNHPAASHVIYNLLNPATNVNKISRAKALFSAYLLLQCLVSIRALRVL